MHWQLRLLGLITIFVDKNRKDAISFLSAAAGVTENLSVYRSVDPPLPLNESTSKSGEKRAVHVSLANSKSFRMVTVSTVSEKTMIELWDAKSGALLWEKGDIKQHYHVCPPRFSGDGRYVVVYDGNWVEVVNAHSAQSTGVVAEKAIHPVAVAVGNNGTSLALSRNDLGDRGFGTGAQFEKSFLNGGRSPIDLVSTCNFYNVQLCYAADGTRLFMAAHTGTTTQDNRVIVMCWDVKTGNVLGHNVCGGKGSSIRAPLLPISRLAMSNGVETSGVVLKVDGRRWFDYEDDYMYDSDDSSKCEKVTTFITYTSECVLNGTHAAEHHEAVCAVVGDEIVIIQNRNYLWSWQGGLTDPKRKSRNDFEAMPASSSINAFALSDERFTIATSYPPKLVFLSTKVNVSNAGSIVLSKGWKRKQPDSY